MPYKLNRKKILQRVFKKPRKRKGQGFILLSRVRWHQSEKASRGAIVDRTSADFVKIYNESMTNFCNKKFNRNKVGLLKIQLMLT